jgi:hypothetical protein
MVLTRLGEVSCVGTQDMVSAFTSRTEHMVCLCQGAGKQVCLS